MKKIHCQFISCNESYKSTCVLLESEQFANCYGVALNLRKMMPLIIYGDYSNGIFTIEGAEFDDTNREKFVQFFSGRFFTGVSKKLAGNLYDKLKEITTYYSMPHFQSLPKTTMIEVLQRMNFKKSVIPSMIENLYDLNDRMTIYSKLREDGGSYADADRLYALEGEEGYTKLFNNPYSYSSILPFEVIDSVAYRAGVYPQAPERLQAILAVVGQQIYQSGSSYTDPKGYMKSCHSIEKLSQKFESLPDSEFVSALKCTKILSYAIEDKQLHIYPEHLMYLEKRIAYELKRLSDNPKATGYCSDVDVSMLDPDQQNALSFLQTTGVKIITGGPGSGKTTLIKKMIETYLSFSETKHFSLAAPTGRAAVRIQESSGYGAQTIHKLLQFQPYFVTGEVEPAYNKSNPLHKGLFIIDEMSMVGEELFLRLLEAIPTGSIVILSGDPRQLPSVEPGNVLLDLINSKSFPTQTLTRIHRQDGESFIVDNYIKIKNYDPNLLVCESFQIFNDNSIGSDKVKDILSELRAEYDLTKYGNPYAFQILSFVKKGEIGKIALNNYFVEQKEKEGFHKRLGKSSFMVGDKVMMIRNNYQDNYFNGDIGIITDFSKDSISIRFYDGEKEIKKSNLSDIEHADVITVHKAQGSEYDTVVIVIDDQFSGMLYNSIILTAITRAKKRVFIISKKKGLERAITFKKSDNRLTGLTYRIADSKHYRLQSTT